MTRATELMEYHGKPFAVDIEIAPIVRALNDAGIRTIASCSGHGFRPGNIALADGRELIIAQDFEEARQIDALFPLDINGMRRWERDRGHEMVLPQRAPEKRR